MLALVENIQRKELEVFEEAVALQNLLLMTEMTQNELAKRLSVSQSNISNKLRLLKLTVEERSLISDASLSERHARALVRIDNERIRMIFLKKIIEKSLSASASEKLINDYIKGEFIKTDLTSPNVDKPHSKATRVGVIKDIRFFYNTIERAVSLLSDAGIKAKSERVEYDDYFEIVIKVAKMPSNV